MPDTGASMCIIGRFVTSGMGIIGLDLMPTTKRLVGAKKGKIQVDGVILLNLTMGNATSNQMVNGTP